MWTISKFFWGLAAAGVGFLLVWKADWLFRNFGAVPWAEKYIHSEGGTRTFYKLLGTLVMILGIMEATGLLEPAIESFVAELFSVTPKK